MTNSDKFSQFRRNKELKTIQALEMKKKVKVQKRESNRWERICQKAFIGWDRLIKIVIWKSQQVVTLKYFLNFFWSLFSWRAGIDLNFHLFLIMYDEQKCDRTEHDKKILFTNKHSGDLVMSNTSLCSPVAVSLGVVFPSSVKHFQKIAWPITILWGEGGGT